MASEMELDFDQQPGTGPRANIPEYSVSEVSSALKRTVEREFGLVRIRGEVSGFKGAVASGHAYFALKDNDTKIDAVCFRGVFSKVRAKLSEGLEVIATGKVTTYPGRSSYQIIIEHIEPAGVGALMQLLEERRRKLTAEGLFDEARKRPLPYLPRVIGVVTSPTGAVIRDILHRLDERFPRRVIVWPVAVQGEKAASEVSSAIAGFNALPPDGPIPRPDVIIVARGGGSIEDLWPFNEEIVVRAAAASTIPLISAVGHETDTTLIDFAADRRAPTPTAAAEMAVPVRADLLRQVVELAARNQGGLLRTLSAARQRLTDVGRGLPRAQRLLETPRQRLDLASAALAGSLSLMVQRQRTRFERAGSRLSPEPIRRQAQHDAARLDDLLHRARLALGRRKDALAERLKARVAMLEALSHRSTLARGFALVTGKDGGLVTSRAAIGTGDPLQLTFADGSVGAVATEGPASPPRGRGKARPQGQGDLF
jgi:exodeoxyribonuclease VII large subunit